LCSGRKAKKKDGKKKAAPRLLTEDFRQSPGKEHPPPETQESRCRKQFACNLRKTEEEGEEGEVSGVFMTNIEFPKKKACCLQGGKEPARGERKRGKKLMKQRGGRGRRLRLPRLFRRVPISIKKGARQGRQKIVETGPGKLGGT